MTQPPGRLYLLYHELRPSRSSYSYALETAQFEKQIDLFLKLREKEQSTLWPEITFDDVDVPIGNLLGERGQGWSIATQLLAYERGPSDINWISRLSTQLRRLEDDVRTGWLQDTPAARARLGQAYAELRALQIKVQRSLTERQNGKLPGPEGSVDKLLLARADQLFGHTMMDLRASDPLLTEGLEWDIYVWSRAAGIYGGTAQIQRNIVAQRVLGLPRS